MVTRSHWLKRIEDAWTTRPIVWLRGVRRVGKTVLVRSLPDTLYFDCDRPDHRQRMTDPAYFLETVRGRRVVLDEVHRLANPSELLKNAADHYPDVRIVATGSSTLQASSKFRDTLTGRKWEVWLVPFIMPDLRDSESTDLSHRVTAGGMPEAFLGSGVDGGLAAEWLEAFWARDVAELFRVGQKWGFIRLCELLMADSGGVFEAARYAAACELSRQTVMNHLWLLESTSVVHVVKPFSTRRTAEILRAPKVYWFDSGFARYARGWARPAEPEMGVLWEHVVLNEIVGRVPYIRVNYWRTKNGSEVDYVITRLGAPPLAIECRWQWKVARGVPGIRAFRRAYPEGRNLVVTGQLSRDYSARRGELVLEIVGLDGMMAILQEYLGGWLT
jgi:predicted AAA+ superfamily ATPase